MYGALRIIKRLGHFRLLKGKDPDAGYTKISAQDHIIPAAPPTVRLYVRYPIQVSADAQLPSRAGHSEFEFYVSYSTQPDETPHRNGIT
jgi:hypothetical protein